MTTTKKQIEMELISDPGFETGFHLLGISPVIDKRHIYKWLDYGGIAKKSERQIWHMSQWWTPYNVLNSTYTSNQKTYTYKTPSRTIQAIPSKHQLYLELLGKEEYLGGNRKDMSQPWSHVLIEQDFEKSISILDISALHLNLEFSIDKFVDQTGSTYDPNIHAAQLLWYFVITDVGLDNGQYKGYGNSDNYFWFGVPLFDSRKEFFEESMIVDSGGVGTTGKLIYTMDSRQYLPVPLVHQTKHHLHVDILPHVKKAYQYALDHGYLKTSDHSDFQIGYMNFGWELPGAFDVAATISNMSAKATLK